MSGEQLARVLTEAGETEMLFEWLEAEVRIVYEDAGRVLADAAAAPEERRRAAVMRERLDRMFVELRELAAGQTENGS